MPIKKIIRQLSKVQNNWKTQSRGMTISHEITKFTKAFKNNFTTLIISAFGFVTALTWNDLIKEVIFTFFPEKGNVVVKMYTAVVITIFAITITYFLSKLKSEN